MEFGYEIMKNGNWGSSDATVASFGTVTLPFPPSVGYQITINEVWYQVKTVRMTPNDLSRLAVIVLFPIGK